MPLRLVEAIPWATLRVRLTLLNTAVVLLAALAALVAVRVAARAAIYRETDAVLRGEVNEMAMALRDLHPDTDAVVAELRRKAAGHEERGWFTQLLTDDGVTIWKSDLCPSAVATWPIDRSKVENLVQIGGFRFARRRITDPTEEPFHVRIGMPTAFVDNEIEAVTRLLLPVGAALALLTPLAGYWLAVNATRPVAEILSRADRLKPTRLGDRLEIFGTRDELDRLSLTINRLLDEVAVHVDRQRQFVADAAHELRGPLAAIQNTLEVASSKDRTPADYCATLEETLEETRRLSKLANGLLLLAEGESETPLTAAPVDVAGVARQTASMFAAVAEDREISLNVEAENSVLVNGDQRQLRQVASNLLDNAIRFTPAGGSVRITLESSVATGLARLQVADTGCGIEPRHLERVFDRFFQADAARDRGDAARGGGLGLAICQAIVKRHGGRISVASRPGVGTTFTVELPLAAGIASSPGISPPRNS